MPAAPPTSRPARSCTNSDISSASSTAGRYHQQQAQLPERHELQPPVLRQSHHGPPAGLLAQRGRSQRDESERVRRDRVDRVRPTHSGRFRRFSSSADQIAFGPGAWSLVTPTSATVSSPCAAGPLPINWNRPNQPGQGVSRLRRVGDINGDGSNTTLFGSNDWANVLYRFSAAHRLRRRPQRNSIHAGLDEGNDQGRRNRLLPQEGCGRQRHRRWQGLRRHDHSRSMASRPPRFPARTGSTSSRVSACPRKSTSAPRPPSRSRSSARRTARSVWDATKQTQDFDERAVPRQHSCLTFSVENVVEPVKTNQNGQGTCSAQNLADPVTGQNDSNQGLEVSVRDEWVADRYTLRCRVRLLRRPVG